jgi:hypothetical protein
VALSAINASQFKIVFNQEVEESSAESATNVSFDGFTPNAGGYELQADNKTLIVTGTPITSKTNVVVTIKNVQLKADTSKTVETFTKVVTVEDTVAPEVTAIESTTNGDSASSVKITYSEPVVAGTVKIDGTVVGTANGQDDTFNITLDANSSHTLQIVNLEDTAGNKTPLVTKTFTVAKDANAPVVSSVVAQGDHQILVKFNKKMDAATIDTTSVTVKDEALAPLNVASVDPVDPAVATDFVITLDEPTLYQNKDSRNLTVVFADTIQDSLGNAGSITTKAVTLNKDKVKPAVTSYTFKKDASGNVTHVVVKFSEKIAAGTYNAASATVIDENGALQPNFLGSATIASDADVIEFPLQAPAALSGTYTITFPAGLVSDTALTPNTNAAYTGTVNFGAGTPSSFKIDQSDVTNPSDNVIKVDFGTQVKGGAVEGSATDPAKYTLNGAALPEGTTITLDAATKSVATITLPEGSINKDDSAAIFTVAGVKNAAGTTITPFTGTTAVKDNVAPQLQSASLFEYNATAQTATFILTFDENVDSTISSAAVDDELIIKNGSSTASVTAATADLVAGKPKQLKVVVTGITLDTTKSITITTVDVANNDIKDDSALKNELKGDVTVSVAK